MSILLLLLLQWDNVIGSILQLILLMFLILALHQLHDTVCIRIAIRRVQMRVDVCEKVVVGHVLLPSNALRQFLPSIEVSNLTLCVGYRPAPFVRPMPRGNR